MKKIFIPILLTVLFLLTACNFSNLIQNPTPQATDSQVETEAPTDDALPVIEPTVESTEPAEADTIPIPPQADVDYSSGVYLDDRSSPAAMIYSLANAFNRHEYIRAYSYWSTPSDFFGSLDDFSGRFADLSSVHVIVGDIYGEGAAGSIYYTAPVIFKVSNSNGSADRLASCLLMRLPQPANYGAPPITPLHIERGLLEPVPDVFDDVIVLSDACAGTDYAGAMSGIPAEPLELEDLKELGPENYIDNRSGAREVVSSLFNAINRHEYVRAYSYWQDPGVIGPYADYADGFSDTGLIEAVFGDVMSDSGAGQLYYQMPVAQLVTTTGDGKQTFVGCFTLHMSNPDMQATPPFEPLGIKNGRFESVPYGTNIEALLATACN